MNIITEPAIDCVYIGDKVYKLNTDFRIWLKFEELMQDSSIASVIKTGLIYDLCFEEPPPYGAALDAVMEFYVGTRKRPYDGKGKRLLSFNQDAGYIYSAFYAQYGIDLTEKQLHWHKFKALFAGLIDEHMIVKIMQIRGMELSDIKDTKQKAHYRKLKKMYRIDDPDQYDTQGLEVLFKEVD